MDRSRSGSARPTAEELEHIVHELEVHKFELESQNEELRQTQVALQASRERYRELFEDAPLGYATLDGEGTIRAANRGMSSLVGVPADELIGQNLSRFLDRSSQDTWYFQRRALKQDHGPHGFELTLRRSDGGSVDVEAVGVLYTEPETASSAIRLALLDVTERRSAEQALRAAASQAALAEQRERRHLAVDLHDDLGQTLSLASLKLKRFSGASEEEKERGLEEISQLLDEVRERISSLSFQISPPILYDVGLVAAAEWLGEDLGRRYGLVVGIVQADEPEMDEATRVTLYRALRELLINVAKHSGVHEAHVRIWQEGSSACLEVSDGGKGFDPAESRTGFGLLALRERVNHLGGTVTISSAHGSGARVLMCMPCRGGPRDRRGEESR